MLLLLFFFGGGMIFWGGNHIPLLSRTSNSNSQLQVARLAVAGDLLASAVAGDQVARSFCSCSRWFWENMFFFFRLFFVCVCVCVCGCLGAIACYWGIRMPYVLNILLLWCGSTLLQSWAHLALANSDVTRKRNSHLLGSFPELNHVACNLFNDCPFCRWSNSLPASWKTTKLFILATTCSSHLCYFTRGCQPFPIQSIASFGRADAKNKTPFGQIPNILRES